MDDMIVVTNGTYREACTVEETLEHSGDTFARVQGDSMSGWVELPENPEMASHVLVCRDCGHVEEVDGERKRVGDKLNALNDRGSAELLQRIHESQTGHSTHIEERAA
jgi:hypothetical protein